MTCNTRELILDRIRKHNTFPSLPLVSYKLNEIVGKEGVSCSEIEKIIMKDPILTSKLLKIVNCSFYGFPQKITSVSKAVLILGIQVIRTIVITQPIMDMMLDIDVALWEHSSCCAMFSRIISQKKKLRNIEEILTAALIQNIGFLFLRMEFPQFFLKIQTTVAEKDLSLIEAEENILGINHCEIGYLLAKSWNLPQKLVNSIKYHHNPSKDNDFPEVSSVIHISDILVSAIGVSSASDIYVPPLDSKSLGILNIDKLWISDLLNNSDSVQLWQCNKKIVDEFLNDSSSENLSELKKQKNNPKEMENNYFPIPPLKKKLFFLRKRFSKVKDNPFLIDLMKIIARYYIKEEKELCRSNLMQHQ